MTTRGQYYAIKAALTVTEKKLIDYYELEWHLRHRVPTVTEVLEHLNNWHEKSKHPNRTTLTAVNYYLQRGKVVKELEAKGIPFRQHTQTDLTEAQIAAALTVMNFTDTRSIAEKLDQLGIASATYYAWLNDPQFKNLVERLSEENLKNVRPAAITEFTKLINKGDWQAIKYYLEVTGAATDGQAPQSEVQIRMIIEVIQRHVKDPKVMMAIAKDLITVGGARTLEAVEEQPAIEGFAVSEVIYDEPVRYNEPSVAEAMNKLGI